MEYDFGKVQVMKKKTFLKQSTVSITKSMVVLATVYFIFLIAKTHWDEIQSIPITSSTNLIISIVIGVIVYLTLVMALAWAWLVWLSFVHPIAITGIYLRSQALKYLPGNIFHFAYRHQQSKKLGVPHTLLIKASINEGIVLIIVATILSLPLLIKIFIPQWHLNHSLIILIPELVLLIISVYFISTLKTWMTILAYLYYFLGMGTICWFVALTLNINLDFWQLLAAYAASWLTGYIIPGAPGGIGVRESAFILLINQSINEGHALLLIAVVRLISLAAESLLFFISNPISHLFQNLDVWSDKTK